MSAWSKRLSLKLHIFASVALTAAAFAPAAHAGWRQTFAEEFDGGALDSNKWSPRDYWGLQLSLTEQDRQCYADLRNVSVAGGHVTLKATNDVPTDCSPDPGNLLYTSGLISTAQSFNQAFGYFEVRMRGARGAGLNSQFRLAVPGGSFPPRPPEIVPGEILGMSPTAVDQRTAWIDGNDQIAEDQHVANGADFTADFHTYGIDWQPGLVVYYVDGVETYRFKSNNVYDQPMYLLLNLSVGSARAGAVDANALPATMDVDYVHVFARVDDGVDSTLPPGVTPPAPKDTTPPVVKLTPPASGAKITFGTATTLSATATDNVGVTEVDFFVGAKQVCAVTKAPFTCRVTFDQNVVDAAKLTITAKAKDAAGNVGQSATSITVLPNVLLLLVSVLKAILKAIFG